MFKLIIKETRSNDSIAHYNFDGSFALAIIQPGDPFQDNMVRIY